MSNTIPHKVFRYIVISSLAVFLSCTLLTLHSNAQPVDSTSVRGEEIVSNPIYVNAGNPEAGIVEQFVRQGQRSYQRKNIQEAINYFARALLLNRANKPARESMALINAQVSLSASRRIQLFLAEDLLAINENLREKLDYFTAKRDTLAKALAGQNYTQSRFTVSTKTPREAADSQDALGTLNKFLILEKQELLQELSRVQEQSAWLRPVGSLREEEAQKTEMKTKNREAAGDSGEPWQQIAGVREELDKMRRQIRNLQENEKNKDERIMTLTKQVIEFSLKSAEREMILNEKVNALGSLHEAYADIQSRQELGQKILEEKNVQIQSLQEGLAALQADTAIHTKEINSLIAAKDQALGEWEKILAIYQGELKDATRTIEARNGDITTLQEKLVSVSTKLFEKETALEKTKQKLASLEQQFQAIVSDKR